MANGRRKTRLELTWIGKEERPKLEPRILLEDPEKSYHASVRRPGDIFDNMLIHGDNLLALKALEADFAGQVKCIYIDPPFNTGEMMPNYDDGLEHSIWLSRMSDRLEVLRRLMAEDGSIFVHIDDNELGYLIVLLDEIFGRANRLYVVTFKQGSATGHKSINPGCVSTTNFLLLYAKNKSIWSPNRVFTARERDTRYGQFIVNADEPFAHWKFTTLMEAFSEASEMKLKDARKLAKTEPELLNDFVMQHASSVIRLARPDYKGVSEAAREMIDASKAEPDTVMRLSREKHSDMYFVRGERILFYRDKLKLIDGEYIAGEPLTTLWDDLLSNNLHKEGGVTFPKGKKPEALIKRALDLCTDSGDLVLDSFAGSGTTAAVAHKMRRKWIAVELGEHAETHIRPRLRSVVDGSDPTGVSAASKWEGGGGFRYYRLAPSLLQKDEYGNWIINKDYNAAMLAEALCKIEGFKYDPSPEVYWQQGRSTETDYIFVTTQTMTADMLQKLSDEVGPDRSLLIMCKAFRSKREWPNLTVKKIPKTVLAKCEWGQDDYSLEIKELPVVADEPEAADAGPQVEPKASGAVKKRRRKAAAVGSGNLFSGDEAEGEGE